MALDRRNTELFVKEQMRQEKKEKVVYFLGTLAWHTFFLTILLSMIFILFTVTV